MTLDALGKHGLRETALHCLSKAEYLKSGIADLAPRFSLPFSAPTFNEVAVRSSADVGHVLSRLEEEKILGGVPLARLAPEEAGWADLFLVAVTEKTRRLDIDRLLDVLRDIS